MSKWFGTFHALDDINLFVKPGQIVGIIGKSGAGKSTLLRCINLLERPEQGDVRIENASLLGLSSLQLRQARHNIGMVFQHFNLLASQTVFDNIALPLRIQGVSETLIRNRVEDLLALVELSDKVMMYPAALSGGQKQRVAIARALASQPHILLCDEATSALDPETTQSILDLLKKINQTYGITLIMVTHNMRVITRICHRVIWMEAGKIKEDYTVAEVFQQLIPEIPPCLKASLSSKPNNRPLLKLLFQGEAATVPFISQVSREFNVDINILLASIDRIDTVTCGALVVELIANTEQLEKFMTRCVQAKLMVEVLGYVIGAMD